MAVSRAASSALHCIGCQRRIISALVSCVSFLPNSAILETRPQRTGQQKRTLISTFPRRSDVAHLSVRNGVDNVTGESEGRSEKEQADVVPPQTAPAPWYLQSQESELEKSNPFAARQRIPDLPSNAPPILQPLLKHISIDLGLDYLSVLDLRSLDPPPALGSGLVMIFGSVRSEKHLNVSADRLCRWLRSTYKLSPNADGLLGRNELKLKLRRKARRSRMLGAVGASEPINPDDGITTGWICVNVGEVENAPDSESPQQRPDTQGFVGFGERTQGTRIVVQMMTEEKRNEVDLESLWQGILEREGRKKEGERRAWERLSLEVDESLDRSRSKSSDMNNGSSSYTYGNRRAASTPSTNLSGQIRGYHTTSKLHRTNEPSTTSNEMETMNEDDLEPHLLPSSNTPTFKPRSTTNDQAESSYRTTTFQSLAPPGVFNNVTAALTLRTQLDYLKKLPLRAAKKQLGFGELDISSTTFLTSFNNSFPAFPEIEHWLCAIELQCFALRNAQPGYTRLHLVQLYRNMQASGIWIPEPVFMLALETILLSTHELNDRTILWDDDEKTRMNAFRRSLGFAFEIIERMENHGYNVSKESIFLLLLRAMTAYTGRTSPPIPSSLSADVGEVQFLADHNVDKLQHQFRRALNLLYTPSEHSDDPIYLALMQACITTGHWDGLWESWRMMARMMKRRGPKMYFLVFSEVAKTHNQTHCRKVLTECLPELERESPPVPISGGLAKAILECLVAAKIDASVAPWKHMIEKCKDGLGL